MYPIFFIRLVQFDFWSYVIASRFLGNHFGTDQGPQTHNALRTEVNILLLPLLTLSSRPRILKLSFIVFLCLTNFFGLFFCKTKNLFGLAELK